MPADLDMFKRDSSNDSIKDKRLKITLKGDNGNETITKLKITFC